MGKSNSLIICNREFGQSEVEIIKEEISNAKPFIREEIARRVCKRFNWVDAKGRAKLMSCKVALLRLERSGYIKLPLPRNGNGNGRAYVFKDILISKQKIILPVAKLKGLCLEPVDNKKASELWNGLISNYHYLGYTPLPGAQKRYIIKWDGGILGAIGFSASAWRVKPRDIWIGWDSIQREQSLHLVINNSRFLILPWVKSRNLASKILSMCSYRVVKDFYDSYGYRPVLLETFVEKGRFAGTSYKAANWIYLGVTKGRGKLDQYNEYRLPVKDIYVYPLHKNFRSALWVS